MIDNIIDGSGERLREIRIRLKKTQIEFADIIKSSNGHISDMEKDKKNITNSTIELLKSKCNVNEDWLRTGNGEMFIEIPKEDEYFAAATEIALENDEFAMQTLIDYWNLDPAFKKEFKKFILGISKKITE